MRTSHWRRHRMMWAPHRLAVLAYSHWRSKWVMRRHWWWNMERHWSHVVTMWGAPSQAAHAIMPSRPWMSIHCTRGEKIVSAAMHWTSHKTILKHGCWWQSHWWSHFRTTRGWLTLTPEVMHVPFVSFIGTSATICYEHAMNMVSFSTLRSLPRRA